VDAVKRAAADRPADDVAALWQELGYRPLFFAIRSGRRDIPVSLALVDGAHSINVVGHDPFQDFELLARLLIEGRRLSRDGFMRWTGDLARENALWRATKRKERTCRKYGFASPEAEFAAKIRAFKGEGAEEKARAGDRMDEAVAQAMADHLRSRRQ
jgi:hypothetical protein